MLITAHNEKKEETARKIAEERAEKLREEREQRIAAIDERLSSTINAFVRSITFYGGARKTPGSRFLRARVSCGSVTLSLGAPARTFSRRGISETFMSLTYISSHETHRSQEHDAVFDCYTEDG